MGNAVASIHRTILAGTVACLVSVGPAMAATWWEAYRAAESGPHVLFQADRKVPESIESYVKDAPPNQPWHFGDGQRLIVEYSPETDLTPPLTIEAWCRPTAHSGYVMLRKHGFGFPAFHEGGDTTWYLRATSKRDHSARYPGIAKLNQWHYYCLTWDGKRVSIYHQGKSVAEKPLVIDLNVPSTPLLIGFSDGWAGTFAGDIGLVRLTGAVLSPHVIARNSAILQEGGSPPTHDALVLERSSIPVVTFKQALVLGADSGPFELPVPETLAPARSLSVSVWLRASGKRLRGPILRYGGDDTSAFRIDVDWEAVTATVRTSDGVFRLRAESALEPERWQNVGIAWNGRTMQMFVNGLAAGRPGLATGELEDVKGTIVVGGDNPRSSGFTGELGEIRFSDTCTVDLPAIPENVGEEVTSRAVNALPDTPPGPRSRHLEGKSQKHAPLVDFEDLSGWSVVSSGGVTVGKLERSREQRCWGEHVAKVVFQGSTFQGPTCEVRILPPAPIRIDRPFGAVDLWVYAHYWGRTQGTAMSVHLRLPDGTEERHDLAANPRWFYWTGWYIAHRTLPHAFPAGTQFTGFTIHGFRPAPEQTLYLDSLTFYSENRSPVPSYVPDWDDLPTPTTPDTVLPPLTSGQTARNRVIKDGDATRLLCETDDDVIEWRYLPNTGTLSDIEARVNGGEAFRPAVAGGLVLEIDDQEREPDDPGIERQLVKLRRRRKHVEAEWLWRVGPASIPVRYTLTPKRKSLVIEIEADTDLGSKVCFGRYQGGPTCQLVRVPYLDMRGFRYKGSTDPAVLWTDTFFLSAIQDWYNSHGSELFGAAEQQASDQATYNGGVVYFPTSDGQRNPVRERFVITASTTFSDVLPNIPNPPSPYLESLRNAFWITRPWYMSRKTYDAIQTGGQPPYYEQETAFWQTLHEYGVRDLFIRRHCAIWRQYMPMNGDPYTFVATTDPRGGGDGACAAHIHQLRDELGYRVGFYTNYTIISPLSYDIWHEDLVCRDSNWEWQTGSLSTAMAKPSRVLPLQRQFAGDLKNRFGVSCSYQDQITCRPFWGCTDYDARVHGAARHDAVFRAHAEVLREERRIYEGPVLSEGACHWYFAGLCDSNYAQTTGMDKPGLLDFQLLRLHMLNNDCGAEIYQSDPDRLAAYCLAHGHIGHWTHSGHPKKLLEQGKLRDFLKAYFVLRAVQPHYVAVSVQRIRYAEENGNWLTTEQAIRAGVHDLGRTEVLYTNGLRVRTNLGDTPWSIGGPATTTTLPPNGYVAEKGGRTIAAHTTVDGHPRHVAHGRDFVYVDGNGAAADVGAAVCTNAIVVRRTMDRLLVRAAPFTTPETITLRAGCLGLGKAVSVTLSEKSNGKAEVKLPKKGGTLR
ncbi:MAG: LamG domain-containing protein [Lentisphaerae bacterium]|jgi:hypothetical protein|nr:LamG domain-containing protein [Lentisphaerota bacterium]MBT4814834.1 LamG domain-containing protein [Lentisphaerota bacterium]MBT5604959.1 LamG domain-containing protein [Lentisphaerota bacterium]MBT7055973.1 LamG domain-containing protein [Lentisphaerota bacterium]MBT7844636.1 LamG domain-containing protein [Lentisphaerota bacterium]